jgi:hypothetical protein
LFCPLHKGSGGIAELDFSFPGRGIAFRNEDLTPRLAVIAGIEIPLQKILH